MIPDQQIKEKNQECFFIPESWDINKNEQN